MAGLPRRDRFFEIYSLEKHRKMCTFWRQVGFQNRQERAGLHIFLSYFQTSQLDHLLHSCLLKAERGQYYPTDVSFSWIYLQGGKFPFNTSLKHPVLLFTFSALTFKLFVSSHSRICMSPLLGYVSPNHLALTHFHLSVDPPLNNLVTHCVFPL